MSKPTIELELFSDAMAESPPKRIDVVLAPDMGSDNDEAMAISTVVAQPDAPDQNQTTIALFPLWSVGAIWVVLIILGAQGVKTILKALTLKDRMKPIQWRRWMFVLPIAVGVAMGAMFGPYVAEAFGFQLSHFTAAGLIGFPSGAAAPWVYMGFRSIVLPLLPATTVGLIERLTGITLPDDLKDKVLDSGLFDSPSEAEMIPGGDDGE